MSVAAIVIRNVASSWAGLASQLAVTFFLTPFVVSELGLEAYGVWLLLQSTVGYYGLVDMGLRAGLTQTITRRIALNDVDGIRRHLGAALPFLSLLGLAVVLIGCGIALLLPFAVGMSTTLSRGLWVVILIQALAVALQMPLAPYSAVLVGLQRYDIVNAISVATRLVTAGLTYALLTFQTGLIGLSLALFISNAIDSWIRYRASISMLPAISNVRLVWDRSELREITTMGVWNLFINASRQLIYFSDALTVGFLFSATAVAPFGIASSLIEYGNRLVIISSRVLFPTMSNLKESGDLEQLRKLYITATRLTLATSLSIVIVGATWIHPFLRLWLGSEAAMDLIHLQTPGLFLALGIAFSFVSLQRTGTQLWLAENKLQSLALSLALEAVVNIILSLLLGWRLGVFGVAIGTAIPAALMCFAVHLPMHGKILQMNILNLMLKVLIRPIVYSILLSMVMRILYHLIPSVDTWMQLILAGIASTVATLLVGCVLLEPYQLSYACGTARQAILKLATHLRIRSATDV